MSNVNALIQQLKAAKSKSEGDAIVLQLKKAVFQLRVMDSSLSGKDQGSSEFREKALTQKTALEAIVLYCASQGDVEGLSRTFMQLEPFYQALVEGAAPSETEAQVLSVYLVALLSEDSTAKFHNVISLYRLTGHSNAVLESVFDLDRAITEGAIVRATTRRAHVGEVFPLVKPLLDRVGYRVSLGALKNMESAANKDGVPVSTAMQVLCLKDPHQLIDLAKAAGWRVDAGNIFAPTTSQPESGIDRSMIDFLVHMSSRLEHIV